MDQRTYFRTALGLLLPTPPIVGEKKGSVVSREELASGYAESSSSSSSADAVFVCKHGYLSEVRVCYAKGLAGSGFVGLRMSCPDTIVREDNCGERIEIASFDGGTSKTMSAIE